MTPESGVLMTPKVLNRQQNVIYAMSLQVQIKSRIMIISLANIEVLHPTSIIPYSCSF
jgi:hypothetical protein